MQLFHFHTPNIKVTVEAYFENGNLVIDGYDIGKTVDEYWGDSDYEYTTTVWGGEVWKLYPLFNIPEVENLLLEELAKKFNTNTCFSDFRNFCDEHGVKYEGFSWPWVLAKCAKKCKGRKMILTAFFGVLIFSACRR